MAVPTLYNVGSGIVAASQDEGATWLYWDPFGDSLGFFLNALGRFSDTEGGAWFASGGANPRLFRSLAGLTDVPLTPIYTFTGESSLSSILPSRTIAGTIHVVVFNATDGARLLKSVDGGLSWATVYTFPESQTPQKVVQVSALHFEWVTNLLYPDAPGTNLYEAGYWLRTTDNFGSVTLVNPRTLSDPGGFLAADIYPCTWPLHPAQAYPGHGYEGFSVNIITGTSVVASGNYALDYAAYNAITGAPVGSPRENWPVQIDTADIPMPSAPPPPDPSFSDEYFTVGALESTPQGALAGTILGNVLRSAPPPTTFVQIGTIGTGADGVGDILADPRDPSGNTLWGTVGAQGVWKSVNGGITWVATAENPLIAFGGALCLARSRVVSGGGGAYYAIG